jgi:NitT/TauT family transport system substrate-binding protein
VRTVSGREADAGATTRMDPTAHSSNRVSRRRFVRAAAGLGLSFAGASLLAGCAGQTAPFFNRSAGNQLETTRIRLNQLIGGICVAPQYVARDLLRAEGFTDIEYVQTDAAGQYPSFVSGEVDIGMAFVAPFIVQLEQGDPIVLLGGVHVGCYEVFGNDSVRAIRDLKGKTVGIPGLPSAHHLFLSSMAAYVGLDPRIDIHWLVHDPVDTASVLSTGKVDAVISFPPYPQELRAKQIGHVVVSSAVDKPWSQYYCCTLAANRDWAQQHPVAARRALRAILKATDICASQPEYAAQQMVAGGFTGNASYALQTLKELPYNRWRDYDPEDTVRFYTLRLHEIGMIKSDPETIIKKGANWQFFNELKQELKA